MTNPTAILGDEHARVLAALTAWAESGCGSVFVIHGPSGTGKRALVDRFMASAAASAFQRLHVRVGREWGINFARDVILRFAQLLLPEQAPFTTDPKLLRSRVLNSLWNWEVDESDGTRPLLISVSDLDASLDGSFPGSHWCFGPVAPAVAWIFTVSGSRPAAQAWLEKLALSSDAVTWASLELANGEAESTDTRLGFDSVAEDVRAGLEREGALRLLDALGSLAATFVPVTVEELAELLDSEQGALLADFGLRKAELNPLLRVSSELEPLSFRHSLARRAWQAADAERVSWHSQRLAAAASQLLERARSGQRVEVSAALRRQAVKWAFVSHAPSSVMLGACEPAFAWPSSAAELVERRSDLDLARLQARALLTQAEFVVSAAAQLAAIELAQGALTSVDQGQSLPDEPFAAWPAALPSLFSARCSLARQASAPLASELLGVAVRAALDSVESWQSPHTPEQLLELAPLLQPGKRARVARLAISALRAQARLVTPLTLVALRFLPDAEAQSQLRQTIALATKAPKPGRALAQLLRGWQKDQPVPTLDSVEIESLFRAAHALPRGSAANALAGLFPVLEGAPRDAALSAIYVALLDESEAEGSEPSTSEDVDYAFCSAAIVPALTSVQVLALLQSSIWTWMGEALVLRLAADGNPAVIERISELTSRSEARAIFLLRAAAIARSPELLLQARTALASLPNESGLKLVADYPQEMLSVLGLEAVTTIASNAEPEHAYIRSRALQALCPKVPEAARRQLAALVLPAFWEDGGQDALDAVVRLAPWLTQQESLSLYATSLDGGQGLARALDGWSSVGALAPLLARAGGDPLIAEVFAALELAEHWLARAFGR